jgi:ATP-dependent RNA helicase CshB
MFKQEIKNAIEKLGYHTFTPIQKSMFDAYLKHEHIIGLAPTGTGKTHAYLLPIMNEIDPNLKAVQAVVCVPTNDLVIQVEKMAKTLGLEVDIKAYVSGKDRLRELDQLTKRQPQLVIATPGKLEDYAIKENKLKIHTANYFVLDEADMMLDLDFITTLDKVFYSVKASHLWMFSATLPDGLDKFITRYFGQSYRIDLKDPSVLNITHGLIMTKMENKDKDFLDIISKINPYIGMVFVSKRETIDHVYNLLTESGYSAVKISGETKVKERKQILDQVRNLKYRFIVSSDIASRGIDLEGVTHVINYELPYQLEFYIHRSGRTGRANRSGIVYTLYTNQQARKIESIEKKGIRFKKFQLTKDDIVEIIKKPKGLSEEELDAIKKIKKPTKVTPNYKKKNAEKIKKAKRIARYGGK